MKRTQHRLFREQGGFSLVELIIVIAIMAALVALLSPQYIKYVERSRVTADMNTVDEIVNAMKIYAADPDGDSTPYTLVYKFAEGQDGLMTLAEVHPTGSSTDARAKVAAMLETTFGTSNIVIKSYTAQADIRAAEGQMLTVSMASGSYAITITPDYTNWDAVRQADART